MHQRRGARRRPGDRLACHHRIVVDNPKITLGSPEVQLGLLPGAGGVVRSRALLGIVQRADEPARCRASALRPPRRSSSASSTSSSPTADDLVPAAKKWIAENPEAQQPWDVDKKYKIPGGTPSTPALAMNLPAFPANLRKQLKGANYPAPKAIMAAAVEGAQVDFDNALEIEGRYFVDLVTGQVAKNMIQAFFFDLQQVNGDRDRPEGIEPYQAKKVVVLGAGMMGAAIAYVCAKAGIEVVLKDVSQEAADRGKGYSEERSSTRRSSRAAPRRRRRDALLALITPTDKAEDAAGADLVIEAVFEDPAVKAQVFAEIEPHLADGALLGSNTSTLPITGLAEGVSRPADFIGLHFFSPVDKMPLLEIIKGEQTGDETLYRSLDFAKQIKKTPIVVNDSRGFFTLARDRHVHQRGHRDARRGHPGADDRAGLLAGRLPGARAAAHRRAQHGAGGEDPQGDEGSGRGRGRHDAKHPAFAVVDKMLEEGRPGKLRGAGFYDYEDGKRTGLWKGLAETFPSSGDPSQISLRDLEERMLFAEALETVKCVDEGVIESVADANIGSIFGIGFPGWTGGVLQYINGYEGGVAGFVARSRELAAQYGDRFEPPASLVEKAERGETYSDTATLATA